MKSFLDGFQSNPLSNLMTTMRGIMQEPILNIEKLVPCIVKALRNLSSLRWKVNPVGVYSPGPPGPHEDWGSGGASYVGADIEVRYRDFIASSPLWLAQMVVGLVEERAKRIHYSGEGNILFDNCEEKESDVKDAYRELGLLERDWTWLKEKVQSGQV